MVRAEVTLSQFLKLAIKMLAKVVIFSCFVAASLAAPTADADADAQILLAAAPAVAAAVAPAVVAPVAPIVAAPAPVAVAPNCEIQYEELTTQVCTPRTETVCETKEVIAQSVEYKKLCKEITSKHCANGIPGYAHVVAKREADAEADAQFWGGYGHFAAPVAYAAHEETHTSPCHEVVAEHCLNNPEVVDTPVPIEQCHVVNKVDCVDHVEKIPKTVCTPVESKIVRHVAHPFGYAYGK
jgi:hypothetical protein